MLPYTVNGGWLRPLLHRILGMILLGCPLFIVPLRCEAQNLVPNPSFEDYAVCPYTVGFQLGDRPLHWYSWTMSPDYFNACCGALNGLDTLVDVPLNGWSYQHAWDGEAYVGGYAYDGVSGDYREFVGAQLIEPLQVGCTYMVRFRTNPAFNGSYWLINGGGVCNNIGLLFTMESYAWTAPTPAPSYHAFAARNYAHVYSSAVITDTLAWTLVEGLFTADSAYAHVVLGNFFTDANTIGYPNGGSSVDLAYYLIDGVEVLPTESGCNGLGVGGAIDEGLPVLRGQGAEMVVELPPGSSFDIRLVDALGRIRSNWHAAGGTLPLPWGLEKGAYTLVLDREGSRSVLKFVLAE